MEPPQILSLMNFLNQKKYKIGKKCIEYERWKMLNRWLHDSELREEHGLIYLKQEIPPSYSDTYSDYIGFYHIFKICLLSIVEKSIQSSSP